MDSNSYELEDVLSALCEHAMPHAKEFRKPTLARPVDIHNFTRDEKTRD